MPELTKHWTEESLEDFLYRIAADYVRQIEKTIDETPGLNQSVLAKQSGA